MADAVSATPPCLCPACRPCREKVLHLRRVRAAGSVGDQMFALRADLLRNLGNITNRWAGAAVGEAVWVGGQVGGWVRPDACSGMWASAHHCDCCC